jgi:hypothetical protein
MNTKTAFLAMFLMGCGGTEGLLEKAPNPGQDASDEIPATTEPEAGKTQPEADSDAEIDDSATPEAGGDAGVVAEVFDAGSCRTTDYTYFPGACPAGYPVHFLCPTGPNPDCKLWAANPAGWWMCCPTY